MPPQDPALARWFVDEVQVHEGSLRAYLRSRFPRQVDLDDLVQEAYGKVLQAKRAGVLRVPKAFLFSAARNAAIDLIRRGQVAPMRPLEEEGVMDIPEGGPDVAESLCRSQELDLLKDAIEALPGRCREVIRMRKLKGYSHRRIALELGVSEHTVNAQIAIGVLRLRDFLSKRGVKGAQS